MRNFFSALKSDLNETIISPLENTDTLSDSVFFGNTNGDFTTQNMFTSKTSASVPTSVTSLFTRSPVMPTTGCETILCEKDTGYFIINSTACTANDSPTIISLITTTADILTNDKSENSATVCYWTIKVPEQHSINLTVDQPSEHKNNGNKYLNSTWKTNSKTKTSSIFQC